MYGVQGLVALVEPFTTHNCSAKLHHQASGQRHFPLNFLLCAAQLVLSHLRNCWDHWVSTKSNIFAWEFPCCTRCFWTCFGKTYGSFSNSVGPHGQRSSLFVGSPPFEAYRFTWEHPRDVRQTAGFFFYGHVVLVFQHEPRIIFSAGYGHGRPRVLKGQPMTTAPSAVYSPLCWGWKLSEMKNGEKMRKMDHGCRTQILSVAKHLKSFLRASNLLGVFSSLTRKQPHFSCSADGQPRVDCSVHEKNANFGLGPCWWNQSPGRELHMANCSTPKCGLFFLSSPDLESLWLGISVDIWHNILHAYSL